MLRETKSYKQTKNLILSNNSFYTLAGAALEKGWVSVECKSTYSIIVCVCVFTSSNSGRTILYEK